MAEGDGPARHEEPGEGPVGTVRLEQGYAKAYSTLWQLLTIEGVAITVFLVAGGFDWALLLLIGLLVAALFRPVLDTFTICRMITLDRATGVVTTSGALGTRSPCSATALTSAALRTWRKENGTLVLDFGTKRVVLRTGEIPEVARLVDELNRARRRLGGGPPVELVVEARDQGLERAAAQRRNRRSRRFALQVDDTVIDPADLDRTVATTTATLEQRVMDLYRLPITLGGLIVVSLLVNIPATTSYDRATLLTVLGMEVVMILLLGAFFLPLTWNARRLELHLDTGEVWATVMRRRSAVGNVTDGIAASVLYKPGGSRQVAVHVGDQRALLRSDIDPTIHWWLQRAAEAARRTGGTVRFDDLPAPPPDPAAPAALATGDDDSPRPLAAENIRGEWTLSVDGPDPGRS